jgi:hypothetical protein
MDVCRHRQTPHSLRSGLPDSAPLKTSNGRFGYEASGDAGSARGADADALEIYKLSEKRERP